MYNNYYQRGFSYKKDNRFVPFAGPFLLGALTGGVAVAAVGPKQNQYYYNMGNLLYHKYTIH